MLLRMRSLAAAVFFGMTSVASAFAGNPVCDFIPLDKRAEPTVRYEVIALPNHNLRFMCSFDLPQPMWGCASEEADDHWLILVDDRLEGENLRCVILHEKAHMPPNNWTHPLD